MNNKTIAVDFDGVIHEDIPGWKLGDIHGKPIPEAIRTLKRLQREGFEIYVLTARQPDNHPKVKQWLLDECGLDLEVTNVKRPAIAYIDDRAIRFTNWQDIKKYFC